MDYFGSAAATKKGRRMQTCRHRDRDVEMEWMEWMEWNGTRRKEGGNGHANADTGTNNQNEQTKPARRFLWPDY